MHQCQVFHWLFDFRTKNDRKDFHYWIILRRPAWSRFPCWELELRPSVDVLRAALSKFRVTRFYTTFTFLKQHSHSLPLDCHQIHIVWKMALGSVSGWLFGFQISFSWLGLKEFVGLGSGGQWAANNVNRWGPPSPSPLSKRRSSAHCTITSAIHRHRNLEISQV